MKRMICALLVLLSLVGACKDNLSVLSTRLQHLSSGALVSCDPYLPVDSSVSTLHTCLVLANPFEPILRVYDVTDDQFLLSPIGYSSLGVRVSGMTTELGSLDRSDAGFAFSLDANTAKVIALNARNQSNSTPSFSIVNPPPSLQTAARVEKFFVVNSGTNVVSLLALLESGHFNVATFDPVLAQYGAIVDVDLGLNTLILDAAYDSVSGIVAVMLQTTNGAQVVLRKVADILAGTNGVSQVVNVVGSFKMALGTIQTDTAAAPHLLLMDQNTSNLSVYRFDPVTLSQTLANTILLASTVSGAYFPTGANKEPCCSGNSDWLSVASNHGMVYYLTAANLLSTELNKVFQASFDLAKESGIGRQHINGLVGMFGGDTITSATPPPNGRRAVCARQIYFVYASGFVANVCEGKTGGVNLMVSR